VGPHSGQSYRYGSTPGAIKELSGTRALRRHPGFKLGPRAPGRPSKRKLKWDAGAERGRAPATNQKLKWDRRAIGKGASGTSKWTTHPRASERGVQVGTTRPWPHRNQVGRTRPLAPNQEFSGNHARTARRAAHQGQQLKWDQWVCTFKCGSAQPVALAESDDDHQQMFVHSTLGHRRDGAPSLLRRRVATRTTKWVPHGARRLPSGVQVGPPRRAPAPIRSFKVGPQRPQAPPGTQVGQRAPSAPSEFQVGPILRRPRRQ